MLAPIWCVAMWIKGPLIRVILDRGAFYVNSCCPRANDNIVFTVDDVSLDVVLATNQRLNVEECTVRGSTKRLPVEEQLDGMALS